MNIQSMKLIIVCWRHHQPLFIFVFQSHINYERNVFTFIPEQIKHTASGAVCHVVQ